jgi:hypothetical protein
MKTRTFPVYSDPGHAWVKVHIPFLVRIIGPGWRKHFTSFSYQRGAYVYLEEDQDARTLIDWCRAAGITPVFKEGSSCSTRYSRIRNYAQLAPM